MHNECGGTGTRTFPQDTPRNEISAFLSAHLRLHLASPEQLRENYLPVIPIIGIFATLLPTIHFFNNQ